MCSRVFLFTDVCSAGVTHCSGNTLYADAKVKQLSENDAPKLEERLYFRREIRETNSDAVSL